MRMRRALIILSLAFSALPALAADVRPDAPEADFRDFNRRFSMAAYDYPRHGAAPLGLIGFDVFADAAVDQNFGDEDFARTVLDDSLTGDALVVARVGARSRRTSSWSRATSSGPSSRGAPSLPRSRCGSPARARSTRARTASTSMAPSSC